MILRDKAAFLQHMSSARYHFSKLNGETEEKGLAGAAEYNLMAIQSVNERLADPNQNTSEQIIAAVLCFVTNAVNVLLISSNFGANACRIS